MLPAEGLVHIKDEHLAWSVVMLCPRNPHLP
jgi:hypothetical protein